MRQTIFTLLFWVGSSTAFANARVVQCDDSKMTTIYIRPNFGTVINFPIKPDNVLLGSNKQFGVEYIKNDVALTALNSNANTNMFVYLLGRRCAFLLTTSSGRYDSIIKVRDPDENKIKVKINE
jgi:hypothetical protein